MKTKSIITCTAALFCLMAGTMDAGTIGINVGSNRGGASLAADETAGVISHANWNNAPDTSGTIADAVDDSGAATGMSVSWDLVETWDMGGSPTTGDGKMMKAWLAAQAASGTVTLSDIPYAQYDLYVYVTHDRAGEDTLFGEAGNAFADFRTVENVTVAKIEAAVFQYDEITASGGTGNYFKVSGLTQSSLTIDVSDGNGGSRGPMAGLQINEVPEPSTFCLAALGLLGLVGFARRRKR